MVLSTGMSDCGIVQHCMEVKFECIFWDLLLCFGGQMRNCFHVSVGAAHSQQTTDVLILSCI